MLTSMTGHGEATTLNDRASVSVELRTVNNRYFKPNIRLSEGYSPLEPRIESVLRQCIKRGTVSVNVRIERLLQPDDFRLNLTALESYRQQVLQVDPSFDDLGALVALPGVVQERPVARQSAEEEWPLVEHALRQALAELQTMRQEEGRALTTDLAENRQRLADDLEAIALRAPAVVENYRQRLTDRLNKLLAEQGAELEPSSVIREVGLFAERADVSEEIARLRSHLDQFATIVNQPESNGKKLDFLTQELNRETNTIGSKANDAEIARHVVDMKAAIERIREMVQNIE